MKTSFRLVILLAVSLTFSERGRVFSKEPPQAPEEHERIDASLRFVFHAVMEGLYEDGVSDEDVNQILMRKKKEGCYFHFIYACPLCSTTIWALEAYRDRPKRFYGRKDEISTFGPGLTKEQRAQLYSDDPQQRLLAVNSLVKTWIERRMKAMRLTGKERANLVAELEKQRKRGMEMLESFRKKEHGESFGVAEAAPAYVDLEECAVCNGAVGKPMKLPEAKRK